MRAVVVVGGWAVSVWVELSDVAVGLVAVAVVVEAVEAAVVVEAEEVLLSVPF